RARSHGQTVAIWRLGPDSSYSTVQKSIFSRLSIVGVPPCPARLGASAPPADSPRAEPMMARGDYYCIRRRLLTAPPATRTAGSISGTNSEIAETI
ncbi:hypothetical protein X777_08070, partial [Ooceraea biroi]